MGDCEVSLYEESADKKRRVSDDSSSASSDSIDESPSSNEDVLLKDLLKLTWKIGRTLELELQPSSKLRFVHSRLKTLHSANLSVPGKLACGRSLHSGIREVHRDEDKFSFSRMLNLLGRKPSK